jgi:hypothetical protein
MLVLDALFDHIQQISSNVEIIGSLVQFAQFRQLMSELGLVSRVSPVHTALRNCTRDEGRSFEVGNQVLISSHRKLLSSKAMVVNVAEKSERDFGPRKAAIPLSTPSRSAPARGG